MATITDDQIRELIALTRDGRQNAHTRALRNDCLGALEGSVTCREHCAEVFADPQRLQKLLTKKRSR
jgi:hypothetical protein